MSICSQETLILVFPSFCWWYSCTWYYFSDFHEHTFNIIFQTLMYIILFLRLSCFMYIILFLRYLCIWYYFSECHDFHVHDTISQHLQVVTMAQSKMEQRFTAAKIVQRLSAGLSTISKFSDILVIRYLFEKNSF